MCCYEHIYAVSWPCLVLLFDIILPGVGTMLQSYCYERGCWNCGTFMVGLLQMITTPFFFAGWIWSIWHGCKVYEVSTAPPTPAYRPMPTGGNTVVVVTGGGGQGPAQPQSYS